MEDAKLELKLSNIVKPPGSQKIQNFSLKTQ